MNKKIKVIIIVTFFVWFPNYDEAPVRRRDLVAEICSCSSLEKTACPHNDLNDVCIHTVMI